MRLARVGHDLATKPPPSCKFSLGLVFIVESAPSSSVLIRELMRKMEKWKNPKLTEYANDAFMPSHYAIMPHNITTGCRNKWFTVI